MSTPPERDYSDEEVRTILQRAAELQEGAPLTQAVPAGTTLRDLEAAAGEAGIDPQLVRRAAQELERVPGGAARPAKVGYGPLRVELVVGRQAAADELNSLVNSVRNALGGDGKITIEHGALIWENRTRRVAVTIAPMAGRSILRVEESLQRLAGSLYGGLVGGVGGGLGGGLIGLTVGLGTMPLVPIAAVAITVAGSFGLARTLYRREVAKRYQQLQQIAADAAATLES